MASIFETKSNVQFKLELEARQREFFKALSRTIWTIEHLRQGRLLHRQILKNLLLTEGANFAVGLLFGNPPPTAISQWYIALFENNYTPVAGDTYATNGWTEWTAYNETQRPPFVVGAVGGGAIDNSANKATFTANATKTLYGGILLGGGTAAATKGDEAGGGSCYAAVRFNASRGVQSGDVLKVTAIAQISDDPT